ncbi:uncharacterized protein LOC111702036 isoform X2 [Eurytemora carolleeae]|uniref:uncharacterized protein LOC111702036 isoform X2 n=1 Tax=Eurytemora carolleeae TaxID=1294199 RepID=UPI000C77B0E1|nr:uncharacterized protein LOC111702036 isoform X2 [Eurytemora carolleeae]|eukprot:XP_023329327.1 uncharacterized protein LOC111702036 isoform X2 [Eurytemora affinis]
MFLFCLLLHLLVINPAQSAEADIEDDKELEVSTDEYDYSSELRRDGVWEAMLNQVWADFINTVNREKELYGVNIEPLQLSPLLGEKVELSRTLLGYQVNLTFWDMWVQGMSGLVLQDVQFKRDESLSIVRTHAILTTPELELDGFYKMEGEGGGAWSWVGASTISSQGAQKFSISMKNVRIVCELHIDLVEACSDKDNAVITRISFPLQYENVHFNFQNIGSILGTVVDVLGRIVIENQKNALVTLITEGIARESPGLLCGSRYSNYPKEPQLNELHPDQDWNTIINRQGGLLYRDRLAERTVEKVFKESILSHLTNNTSPLRQALDPLPLFPLEFDLRKRVFRANVAVCNVYLHNIKKIKDFNIILLRDRSLQYSALRVTATLPLSWMTGEYKMKKGVFLSIFPVKAGGDFNIDFKQNVVRMIVVLRNTTQGLVLEHFSVDSEWRETTFSFDGVLQGLGELADMMMNELGVGEIIVKKQKSWVMDEIKEYTRGMAECVMWRPSLGLELCMRQFWIEQGWSYPWTYPTCS